MCPAKPWSRMAIVLAGGLAVLAAGCDAEPVYFRPVDQNEGGGQWARYALAARGGKQAEARVAARGAPANEHDKDLADKADVIVVHFRLKNELDAPVRIDAAGAALIDDEGGRIWSPTLAGKSIRDGAIVCEAGKKASARLIFELPEGERLGRLGSFRLAWSAKAGEGDPESFQTKFVKTAPPEVYYEQPYYPYPYPYYGYPYYGYPYYGYYDPFYPPYYPYGGVYYRHHRH